jgi:hypothetical protein
LGFTIPNAGGVVTSAGTLATLATSPLNNQFEALYGFSLSDATTLGIGISRATNSTKVEVAPSGGTTGSNENAVGDFGISLGLEQKEVGPISLLEVGLQYNSRGLSAADKGTVTNKITGSGTGINLRVGGDMAGEGGKFSRVELGFNTRAWASRMSSPRPLRPTRSLKARTRPWAGTSATPWAAATTRGWD